MSLLKARNIGMFRSNAFLFISLLSISTFFHMVASPLMASNIGHMGRLVDNTGAPLTGTANLQFEVHYSGNLTAGAILCNIVMTNVPLTNGVYHANINFADGTGVNCDLNDLLKNTPVNQSLVMRVNETTRSLTFDWQNILHVPAALRSDVSATAESVLDGVITAPKINQMGATSNQVLTWNGSAWQPQTLPPGNAGTVTSVGAGAGLSAGGTSADPVLDVNVDGSTIEIATDTLQVKDLGITTTKLSANAVTPAKMGLNTNQFDPLAPILSLSLNTNGALGTTMSGLGVLTNSSFLEIATNQLTLANSGVTPGTYTSVTVDAKGRVTSAGTLSAADLPDIELLETSCANGEIYVADTGFISCQRHLDFIRIGGATNYVELRIPGAHTGTSVLTFPSTAGAANQVLTTDGTGVLSWQTPATSATPSGSAGGDLSGTYPNPVIAAGAVTYSKTNFADGAIPQAKISGLATSLGAKENTITAGATTQYYRGDKTWRTLDSSVVPENTNLYYTAARARADAVVDAIVDGVLTIAPSQNAVFDALALKQNTLGFTPVNRAGDTMTGNLTLNAQNELRLADADSSNYVSLRSPAVVGTNVNLTLPNTAGTTGQVLSTDGAGILSWITPATGTGDITDVVAGTGLTGGATSGSATLNVDVGTTASKIVQLDTSARLPAVDGSLLTNLPNPTTSTVLTGFTTGLDATVTNMDTVEEAIEKLQGQVNGSNTELDTKENAITAGATTQYYRGDKTWQTLDSSVVPENTNLYYTAARARADAVVDAIVDGVLDIAPSQNAVFDALALKANATALTNYVAISGSNMTGPLGLNAQNQLQFRDGDSSNYVAFRAPASVAANIVFNLPAADGSTGQVLSTDGAGNLAWASSAPGTVTNVTASAPLSSTGGLTPNLTISQANTTTNGFLSSTDWNIFNNKEAAIAAGTTAQYRRGDKTWQTLNTAAVPESGNLYYTTARARTDAVADTILDGVLNIAPSQNAVFDALALKANTSSLSNYVLKTGDTMTGALNLPANGLTVGTNQLVAVSGSVGIGTATPVSRLNIVGGALNSGGGTGLGISTGLSAGRFVGSPGVVALASSTDASTVELSAGSTGGQSGIAVSGSGGDVPSSMRVWTNNAERIRINSSGNVGIGTTAPSSKLNVVGPGTSLMSVNASGLAGTTGNVVNISANSMDNLGSDPVLVNISAGSMGNVPRGKLFNASNTKYQFELNNVPEATGMVFNRISSGGYSPWLPDTTASGETALQAIGVTSSNWFDGATPVVGSAVNVNISGWGGSTPSYRRVYGVPVKIRAANPSAPSYGFYADVAEGSKNWAFYAASGDSYFDGNVGIGTTTPLKPLHVMRAGDSAVGQTQLMLQGGTAGYGAGITFQAPLTGGVLTEMARITADGENTWNTTTSTQDAGLRFYTAADGVTAEKVRILSNGNVGIGTTNPSVKLEVMGGNIQAPDQVSFEAKDCSGSVSAGSPVVWETVNHNAGGAYNSSNGVFTAPVTGVYNFGFNTLLNFDGAGEYRYEFYKNSGLFNGFIQQKTVNSWQTIQGTVVTRLNAGDTIYIQYTTGSGVTYTDCNYNRFWGRLEN